MLAPALTPLTVIVPGSDPEQTGLVAVALTVTFIGSSIVIEAVETQPSPFASVTVTV
ncbi:hypothetical protein D3C85_1866550 [compost metagenome]